MLCRLLTVAFATLLLTAPAFAELNGNRELAISDAVGGSSAGTAGDYYEHCEPRFCFYAQADALFLQRSNGSSDQPVVLSDTTGSVLLSTDDFGFDFVAGPRILIGWKDTACSAWEMSYFGTHFWDESIIVTGTNDLDIPGPLAAVADDFDNADQMGVSYRSQLHNAEVNRLFDRECWSWLAGFRYVNLDETFRINTTDSDGDVSDYTIRASNNLFGGQLGARIQRATERFDLDLIGKAGVFGTDSIQRQSVLDNDNSFVLRDTSGRQGTVSFVGDINFTAAYRLTERWSARAGYNIMYIAGVALAPDQLDFEDLTTSGTAITTGGDLFLHGVNVGLEAHW